MPELLSLAPLKVADVAPERRPEWLAEAERAVLGTDPGCSLPPLVDAEAVAYWIRVKLDGERGATNVGACAARIDGQDLVWSWLAVGQPWRAFGYGGAAVPLVERAAQAQGAQISRVRVPASNGVALYFWLRLGYRTVGGGSEWGEPYPGTWMSRSF